MYLLMFFILATQALGLQIKSIFIEGNKEVPKSVILDNISIKVGDEFTFDIVYETYQKLSLLKYIQSVEVLPVIKDGLEIKIKIQEKSDAYDLLKGDNIYTNSDISGKKIPPIVSSIVIENLLLLEEADLLKKINIKVGSYYSIQDLDLAKITLERTGLFKKVQYTSFGTENGIEVKFDCIENDTVDNITFSGSSIFTEKELSSLVTVERNAILNTNKLKESKEALDKLYLDKDYIAVIITFEFKFGLLEFKIYEPIVGNVSFEKPSYFGNTPSPLRTKEYVFRRVVSLKKGDVLRKSDLFNTIYEIRRYGLFKTVTPDIRLDPDPRIRNIIFRVEEEVGIKINLSFNGSLNGDLVFTCGFEENNFLGRAQNFLFNLEYNMDKKWKGKLSFFDPWIKGTDRLAFGAEIYRSSSEANGFEYFDNTLTSGIGVTFSFPLVKNLKVVLKNNFTLVTQLDTSDNLCDRYLENILAPSIIFDKTNNYIDPTSGIFLSTIFAFNSRFKAPYVEYDNFEKKSDIISLELTTRLYSKFVVDQNVIAFRFYTGFSKFISDEVNLKRYTIGGYNTIRGYEQKFKGNKFSVFNIEDRITLYDDQIKLELAIFADAGMAVQDFKDLVNWSEYKKSFGFSFRIKKFLLPLSLDFSFPLDGENKLTPGINLGFIF